MCSWTYAPTESCLEGFGVCFWLTRNIYTLEEYSWCQHMQNRIPTTHADVGGMLTQTHTLSTRVLWKSGQVAPWKCLTRKIKGLKAKVLEHLSYLSRIWPFCPMTSAEFWNLAGNKRIPRGGAASEQGHFLAAILWLRGVEVEGLSVPTSQGQEDFAFAIV